MAGQRVLPWLSWAWAHVIDAFARRAASVAEGGASFGFSYHADHDAWQCPQDQWLWPQSFDPEQPGHALPGNAQRSATRAR